MSRRLLPLLDRILVAKVATPSKSTGGVLLPEAAVSKVNEAVVVAAGPGRRDDSGKLVPMEVKEGDTVVLPDYGGHSLKLDGKEFHIYRADDILGILKPIKT